MFLDLSTPFSWGLTLFLWLLCSSRFVLFALLFKFFFRQHLIPRVVQLPLAWVSAVFLLPEFIPWRLSTFLWWSLPTVQFADCFGMLGLSFILLCCTELVIQGIFEKKRSLILSCLGLILLLYSYGIWRISSFSRNENESLRVLLVQSDLDPRTDFNPERRTVNKKVHQQITLNSMSEQKVDLVIWPESSVSEDFTSHSRKLLVSDPRHPFAGLDVPLLFGGQQRLSSDESALPRYHNTAFLLQPTGDMKMRYDKVELFPFGERIPLQNLLPFMKAFNPNPFEMIAGDTQQAVMLLTHAKRSVELLPTICYEDIIPDSLRYRISSDRAQVLVNLTNDAWFPHTRAQVQHHYLAVMRAIEFRRPLLRASVNGVTGVVHSTGRQEALASDTRGGLHTRVTSASSITWYALWGDWPIIFLCIGVLIISFWRAVKSRNSTPSF